MPVWKHFKQVVEQTIYARGRSRDKIDQLKSLAKEQAVPAMGA